MLTKIEEKLTVARVGLILRHAFFGNMASRMKLIDATDWCSTAATDGRNFFYNSEFVEKLSTKNLEFLFAHEILHCAFDHFERCGSRNRKLANLAQDYAVNQILVDDKIGSVITLVNICQDDKYRGMAWEEIYDQLMENAKEISMEDLIDMLGEQLDEHINGDSGNGNGNGDGNSKEGNGNASKFGGLTKEEIQQLKDEIKQAMIQSASAAGVGSTPAAIQRMIKDLTEPKINWRDFIQMQIQSIVRSNYSFSRPSRKGYASGAVLPGLVPEDTIDIAIAIDMSGSISDMDAATFLGEINGIVSQYTDFAIDIWCFDTDVYNHARITQDNIYDLENYEVKGGGGTSIQCNYDWMQEVGIQPKKLFFFTDLCVSEYGDEDYCDVVWLVKDNPSSIAPHGETVHYEKLA